MSDIYSGPIIDAHHHLWDLAMARHPWLVEGSHEAAPLGDIAYLRHSYLPDDFRADAGARVVGSVHIEALWDRGRDRLEEQAWLDTLDLSGGIAARRIAFADLASPAAAATLDRLAAHPQVAGVRETIRWHPDPGKRWAAQGILDTPGFRAGAGHLERHGLVLDLLMNPWQSAEIVHLARALPTLRIILNHCASPVDRDSAGLARWRAGLAAMAACENIAIKVSAFGSYGAPAETISPCLDAFGPTRAMFGTDYPVARRRLTYPAMLDAFAAGIAGFSADEQRALFYGNARIWYGFPD